MKFLKISLFALITLPAFNLLAQEMYECDDLSRVKRRTWICINFNVSGPDYFLQRLQSDLGPGADVDASDFTSIDRPNMKEVKRWRGVERKDWSESPIDITLFSDGDALAMVSFINQQGENLIAEDFDKKRLIKKYLRDRLNGGISYVKAKGGAKVRSGPSSKAPVIQTLNFGEEVWIIDGTKKFSQIREGNKTIKSEWIKIANAESAYISDIYLVQKNEIPPQFLTNHGRVHGRNLLNGQGFDTDTVAKPISSEKWDAYADSIGKFVELSLVDIDTYKRAKIKNKYSVDTTHVERRVLLDSGRLNSFYLTVNAGKDSIHIQDTESEMTTFASFIGQIPGLNKYVVRYYYESPSHSLYDKTTGEQKTFTSGFPYISPDGKYVIAFYKAWTYPDYNNSYLEGEDHPIIEWCQFSISGIQPDLEFSEVLSVEFSSWIPVEVANSAFWISDRELIIKAISATNREARKKIRSGQKPLNSDYQYIKVKIVNR